MMLHWAQAPWFSSLFLHSIGVPPLVAEVLQALCHFFVVWPMSCNCLATLLPMYTACPFSMSCKPSCRLRFVCNCAGVAICRIVCCSRVVQWSTIVPPLLFGECFDFLFPLLASVYDVVGDCVFISVWLVGVWCNAALGVSPVV